MMSNLSLEEELSNLIPEQQVEIEEEENIDDDLVAYKRNKSKKKEKKERKLKKREKDIFGFIADDDDFDSDDESLSFLVSKKVKNKREETSLFDTSGRKPKDENYETRFREEQSQLNKVLKDAEDVYTASKEIFDTLKDSKARGTSKMLTDVMSNLNSANTTRLQIIKEKSNLKKNIAELKLKQKQMKDKEETDNNNLMAEEFGSKYLTDLYSSQGNRTNVINAINNAQSSNYDPNEVILPSNFEDESGTYDIEYDEDADDIISKRVKNSTVRSDEVEANIKYEHLEPETCIKVLPDNTYEVYCIDKFGNPMPDDYPVPTPEMIGKLTYKFDSNIATDSTGRIYRMI